jgi:hypothetical protein
MGRFDPRYPCAWCDETEPPTVSQRISTDLGISTVWAHEGACMDAVIAQKGARRLSNDAGKSKLD